MKFEILGAGGAWSVPRPFCECAICEEARQKGAPYTRLGPSIFVHDLELLIDTPEEISVQLNRARIRRVKTALYSHWHPDHTAGIRVWEANYNNNGHMFELPAVVTTTEVYLAHNVARTFEEHHALKTKCEYLQRFQAIHVNVIPDGGTIQLDGVSITPVVLTESYACAFLFVWRDGDQERRALVAIDETFQWIPPAWVGHLDLFIVPAGVFEFNPLTGERLIPADHPIMARETTLAKTLDMLKHVDAARVVFVHLNESDRLSHDDYKRLARLLNDPASPESAGRPPVEFAYDTQIIAV